MGLKKSKYEVPGLGITVPTAYARLTYVDISLSGEANAIFEVQQDRDSVGIKNFLERKSFSCSIDKELPVHRQIYEKAKEGLFADWQDDIVEPEIIPEEVPEDTPEEPVE